MRFVSKLTMTVAAIFFAVSVSAQEWFVHVHMGME